MGRIYLPHERQGAVDRGEIPEGCVIGSPNYVAMLDNVPGYWASDANRYLAFSPMSNSVFLSRPTVRPINPDPMAATHRLLINSLEDAATVLEVIRLVTPRLVEGRG